MRKRRKVIQRGERGYISYRKKQSLLFSAGILAIALAIFLIGLLLNKMSRANIFTVLAILCVLPWARQMVFLIVILPFHSVTEERYQRGKEAAPEGMTLYTDLVITSPEKVMNLDFAAVGCGKVVVLPGRNRQDAAYIQKYLAQGVHGVSGYSVEIYEEEETFLRELEKVPREEVDPEEQKRVVSYLLTLNV